MTMIKTALVAAATFATTTAPAMAQSWWWWWGRGTTTPTPTPTVSSVPEIDGSTAVLGLAAVFAMLALAWERKRRRA